MAIRIITFAFHKDDGLVISRVGSEIAVPVLEFEKIGQDGDFTGPMEYHLERFPVHSMYPSGEHTLRGRVTWEPKEVPHGPTCGFWQTGTVA